MKDKKQKNAAKARLLNLDLMVGLAMIFVVLGHMSFPFSPSWYNDGLHAWIYRFHMEVFVFLSAFLIRYSYKGVSTVGDYFKYEGRKLRKFFIPFLLVGLVVALAKAWSYDIVKSEIWGYMWESLKCLLLYPMASEASFLWYIYVLFGYYLISPLVFKFPSWLKMLLCLLCMGLPLLGANHLLGGYMFCKYTFFYFLGVLCAEGWEQLRDMKTWLIGLLSLPFVLWSVKYILFCLNPTQEGTFLEVGPQGYDILSGCIALPFFYFLARILSHLKFTSKILCRISKDCFWIYLFQMFIGWGGAYALKFAGVEETFPFVAFIIICSLLCLSIPIGIAWLSNKIGAITLKPKRSMNK